MGSIVGFYRVLGSGFRVVMSGVASPPIWVTAIVILLLTSLVTSHEPPSRAAALLVEENASKNQSSETLCSTCYGALNPITLTP